MCSLHARIAKKFNLVFEGIRDETKTELTDDNLVRLKVAKHRAADEFIPLKGCAMIERYQRILNSPTPPAKSLSRVQAHIEELIKTLK